MKWPDVDGPWVVIAWVCMKTFTTLYFKHGHNFVGDVRSWLKNRSLFPKIHLDSSVLLEFPVKWPAVHCTWVFITLICMKTFTTLYFTHGHNFVGVVGSCLKNRSLFPNIHLDSSV
jgi:hypothetical protein